MIIKKMPVKLIREFEIGDIDLLIGPACIEAKAHQAPCVDHLVISDGSIYPGRSKITAAGDIVENHSTQTKPPGIIMIFHYLNITESTHCFIRNGHNR